MDAKDKELNKAELSAKDKNLKNGRQFTLRELGALNEAWTNTKAGLTRYLKKKLNNAEVKNLLPCVLYEKLREVVLGPIPNVEIELSNYDETHGKLYAEITDDYPVTNYIISARNMDVINQHLNQWFTVQKEERVMVLPNGINVIGHHVIDLSMYHHVIFPKTAYYFKKNIFHCSMDVSWLEWVVILNDNPNLVTIEPMAFSEEWKRKYFLDGLWYGLPYCWPEWWKTKFLVRNKQIKEKLIASGVWAHKIYVWSTRFKNDI